MYCDGQVFYLLDVICLKMNFKGQFWYFLSENIQAKFLSFIDTTNLICIQKFKVMEKVNPNPYGGWSWRLSSDSKHWL